MPVKVLSQQAVSRALTLAQSAYRPNRILALKSEIARQRRISEYNFMRTGFIDYSAVNRIVFLMRELDGLYGAWAEGWIH